MADDTQSEDYKVLQAMRTEISGLVEAKNRLDLEIKKLEEDKVQAELEYRAVKSKLDDVSGEWSNKMRELIDKETTLDAREVVLTTQQSEFERISKEREEALKYTESQVNSEKEVIQQERAESAKLLTDNRHKEQEHALQGQRLRELEKELDDKRASLVNLESVLNSHSIKIDEAKKTLSTEEAKLRQEAQRLRELEGQVAKASTKAQEEVVNRERQVKTREDDVARREIEVEKKLASMDTRMTKREAEEIKALKAEVDAGRQKLARERSEFELDVKNKHTELYNLKENIKSKGFILSNMEGKIAEIERREKGVADAEAGIQAREKQLMFEIAKFKKRVKDAKMEEVINESG